ncbi:hypothetical protein GH810_09635 [Acetobacterium paludosum]|uniref:Uncharacterized protein n=1 Tax=Acetobacterium paludosum TaxID=52693 RepID=A0A923I204_9FIRM|nr:hypothetical protein [Acetobacterium paludosum]MBC3888568.1 hypothetical protein [Acetobacterium paludosum]
MKKILEKAKIEGWTDLNQGLACGNRMEFVKGDKKIGITLNPASYQLTNMLPSQMTNMLEADTLYASKDPVIEKIRNLSFEDQAELSGVARELFLLICQED